MRRHTVRPGETLSSIAKRYGTTWQALARANAIDDPNRVAVGRPLLIPSTLSGHPQAGSTAKASSRTGSSSPHDKGEAGEGGGAPDASGRAAGAITEGQLRAIMPHAGANVASFVQPLNVAMRAHGISGAEQRAAFLAQVSVESGDLRHTEENLHYSAARLHQVWPRRFHSAAAAQPYAQNPEALGNHIYANRLGNGDEASGDGYRFRGRGLMQVTGRDNYRAAGFENQPEALAAPGNAADSAARFWETNGLNPRTRNVLTRGPFNGVTRTVNGGDNGSQERWDAYQRALHALGRSEGG